MSRVLVVDDNADIRRLVLEVLRLEGVDVEEADTGLAAMERLAADPLPDVVVLDVQMPHLDGWDTLRRIRALPRTAAVPVILCTVKSGPVDTEMAALLDSDGFLTKPFEIDELVVQVRGVLVATAEELVARRAAARLELAQPT